MSKYKFSLHLLLAASLATGVFVTGCKKDDNETETENITKIVVHLTGITDPAFHGEFNWKDPDGDGGTAPTIDQIVLPANASYHAEIEVYDETKNPVEDVTEEIKAENKVHLFEYRSMLDALTIGSLNKDDDGKPFGRESTWTTTAAATGSLRILLHHEPTDKLAADPGGEIDFDVTFPVKVQ